MIVPPGFQQTFFSLHQSWDADAVFTRAAGIQHLRLDPHLRLSDPD